MPSLPPLRTCTSLSFFSVRLCFGINSFQEWCFMCSRSVQTNFRFPVSNIFHLYFSLKQFFYLLNPLFPSVFSPTPVTPNLINLIVTSWPSSFVFSIFFRSIHLSFWPMHFFVSKQYLIDIIISQHNRLLSAQEVET